MIAHVYLVTHISANKRLTPLSMGHCLSYLLNVVDGEVLGRGCSSRLGVFHTQCDSHFGSGQAGQCVTEVISGQGRQVDV